MNNHLHSHLQRPTSEAPATLITGILKRTVTARLNREFGEQLPSSLFRRAIDDAESVAHATDFPNLFFPALAEEKVRLVSAAIAPDSRGRSPLCHAA
jgi:hypothetical protein